MIHTALLLLRNELAHFIKTDKKGAGIEVDIRNIAFLETDKDKSLEDRIIISLVNVEEESVLKNSLPYMQTLNGGYEYRPPAVNLNLYLLITSNLNISSDTDTNNSYIKSLQGLSYVIEFFQHRNGFTVSNALSKEELQKNDGNLAEIKLFADLYTLTFEQINHLWGSLGGRQIPFCMYKVRLVSIQNKNAGSEIPVIEEIKSSIQKMN